MNTRTFHAASVQDAIRQARRELGADAMLLNSKRIPAQKHGGADQFAVKFAYANTVPPTGAAAERVSGGDSAASAYHLALQVHEPRRVSVSKAGKDDAAEIPPRSQSDGSLGGQRPIHHQAGLAANDATLPPRSGSSSPDSNTSGEMPAGVCSAPADPSSAAVAVSAPPGSAPPSLPACDGSAADTFEKLRDQMLSMRKEMLQLAGSVRRVSSSSYRQKLASDSLRHLYDLLVEQDFHPDLIERLLATVGSTTAPGPAEAPDCRKKQSSGKTRPARSSRKRDIEAASATAGLDDTRLFAALQDAIAAHIDLMAEPGLRRKRSSPLVISLVGPPGVGKTTTLVKLAVRYSELSRFPIQIISMDNFRVGASEQLRAYASVLGVGFDTLSTVPALERALHEYSSKEIILVDTPGLGWRDFDAADDLAGFLGSLENKITHMVAPASMRPADFERLADLYEAFDYDSLIYTKLDETASIGQLVSESWRRNKPLAYFATGQRIPDDLELASRERICERILPTDAALAHFAA
ncbi:MAG: hypothetical protein LC114_20075 [Bryobacterales bacterium]|nr:hypothetical protein [Bryobacterales bacterium]